MRRNTNRKFALRLAIVVPLMLAASFAAVPLYNWFCSVTGYGGTTGVADAPEAAPIDRWMTVSFDANTAPDMPWEFRVKQRTMKVRLGETAIAYYEAYNPTDQPVAGSATYNVAPFSVGRYFEKIACFCFQLQVLQPGERVEMPVTFFIDPEMVENREARDVIDVTLSYTMFLAEMPEEGTASQTALAPVATPPSIVTAEGLRGRDNEN